MLTASASKLSSQFVLCLKIHHRLRHLTVAKFVFIRQSYSQDFQFQRIIMRKIEVMASVMVGLMAILQAVYGVYAYLDPAAFSELRGTHLFSAGDSDWVGIYASRTLFVALIIALLLIRKEFNLLMWAALFGTVMPITDAWLAHLAGAESAVVYKHLATIVYLLATSFLLKFAQAKD